MVWLNWSSMYDATAYLHGKYLSSLIFIEASVNDSDRRKHYTNSYKSMSTLHLNWTTGDSIIFHWLINMTINLCTKIEHII
jgi:hypothetical protein